MDLLLVPLFSTLSFLLSMYWYAVIIYVILEWLENFNVINKYNQFVYSVHTILFRIVEPSLEFFRRFIPPIGGVDLSPIGVLASIFFLQIFMGMMLIKFGFR